MNDIPILMSAPMVRATLREIDPKTQTRRVVKGIALEWLAPGMVAPEYVAKPQNGLSPYGYAGDRLWVKETHAAFGRWETRYSEKKKRYEWHFVDMTIECGLEYRFDFDGWPRSRRGAVPGWHVRPSIFIPRIASRITLENTAVRVEQLWDISEADAMAEGVYQDSNGLRNGAEPGVYDTASSAYHALWDSLNAARGYGWDVNPWVWAISFRRVTRSSTSR